MKTACLILLAFAPLAYTQPAHSVALSWSYAQGAGGNASGFQIQRAAVAGGPYTTIGTIASVSTLAYTDASAAGNVLAEGQKYCYVVEATGPGGVSSPSNEACATVPFSPPSAPSAVSAVAK